MDRNVIMCWPVGDYDDPVEGSTQEECVGCGTPVWVAPSSAKLLGEADPICVRCIMHMGLLEKPENEIALAPGALEEMLEHGRKKNGNGYAEG